MNRFQCEAGADCIHWKDVKTEVKKQKFQPNLTIFSDTSTSFHGQIVQSVLLGSPTPSLLGRKQIK